MLRKPDCLSAQPSMEGCSWQPSYIPPPLRLFMWTRLARDQRGQSTADASRQIQKACSSAEIYEKPKCFNWSLRLISVSAFGWQNWTIWGKRQCCGTLSCEYSNSHTDDLDNITQSEVKKGLKKGLWGCCCLCIGGQKTNFWSSQMDGTFYEEFYGAS